MSKYPNTLKKIFSEEIHGVKLEDSYQWLENAKSNETLNWVAEQNQYTDSYFNELGKYSVSELEGQLKINSKGKSYSSLYELNGKIFAAEKDSEGKISIVILDMEFNKLEQIVDANEFEDVFKIYSVRPSILDNGILNLQVLCHGYARPSVVIYDYFNKKIIKQIDGVFSSIWMSDGKRICYSNAEEDIKNGINRNFISYVDHEKDEIVNLYEYKKNAPFLTLSSDKKGDYIFVSAMRDYENNELIVIDPRTLETKILTEDNEGNFDYIGTSEGYHFIKTNVKAPFGKIVKVSVNDSKYEKSIEVITQSNKIISDAYVEENQIIVTYMKDVSSEVEIFDLNGRYESTFALPSNLGSCNSVGFSGTILKNTSNMYFEFESFTTAPTIMKYDVTKRHLRIALASDAEVPEDIIVTQQFIDSRDGIRIPAYIVHKKDIELNGNNPTIMYGYGGYNAATTPAFTNPFIGLDVWKWVNKGGIYVNCNIRGGNEYGTKWHTDGNLMNKKNVFNDFVDIAEALIENKWTNPKKIAICGGSNGGLLMTALTTKRPDLWRAVIASVPHTDMIRFMYDDRGPMYTTEYGNPREEDMFEYMLSYSPYHNIKDVEYPAMYIQTGECDNNVPPYHGKKFAAKMQELNISENPILLRVLAMGSHDRGTGDVMYRTTAEMQTFIAKALEI